MAVVPFGHTVFIQEQRVDAQLPPGQQIVFVPGKLLCVAIKKNPSGRRLDQLIDGKGW